MIKEVLVLLDGSATGKLRLQHAEAIAVAAEAHITGLLTNRMPDVVVLFQTNILSDFAAIHAR